MARKLPASVKSRPVPDNIAQLSTSSGWLVVELPTKLCSSGSVPASAANFD